MGSSPFFSPGDSFFHISISSAVFVHSERTVMRLEFPDKVGQTNAFTHIDWMYRIYSSISTRNWSGIVRPLGESKGRML